METMTKPTLLRMSYGKMTRSKQVTKEIKKRISKGLSEGKILKINGDCFGKIR